MFEQQPLNKIISEPNAFNFQAGVNENHLLALVNKYFNENNYHEAEFHLEWLIDNFTAKAEYFSALAVIKKKLNKLEEAEIYYRKALGINSKSFEAFYNLGILFYEQSKIAEAIECFLRAVEIKPDLYLAYYNLGNAYRERNEYDQAVICYREAIKLKKDFDDAHYNLGVVYEKQRDFVKAFECYDNAIILNMENLNARWNRALLNLQMGNYSVGWQEYEVRKKRDKSFQKNTGRPELKDQNVNGKKIFVYSEQGLGDSIQFVRYLQLLKNAGAYVIYECKPQLLKLFHNVDGIDELVSELDFGFNKLSFDYQVSLLSLPLYFETLLSTIPSNVPYIKPDPGKVIEWKRKIGNDKCFKIGIAWAGAAANTSGKNRTCSLHEFAPLFSIDGIKIFSLQKSNEAEQINSAGLPINYFDEFDATPFIDTAAIIENLDLVISVDTSIAHLAGAMGKTVWTLLPYYPDWRWLLERSDSPWYPAMKLFRQQEPGKWDLVLNNVKKEILQNCKITKLHD